MILGIMILIYFALCILGYFFGGWDILLLMISPILIVMIGGVAYLIVFGTIEWFENTRFNSMNSKPIEKVNKAFLSNYFRENPEKYKYASDVIRADRDILYNLIETFPFAIIYASPSLQNDKELVVYALRQAARLEYETFIFSDDLYAILPKEIKSNREVVLAALKYSKGKAIYYVEDVQIDESINFEDLMTFGKYKGFSIHEIAEFDSAYLKEFDEEEEKKNSLDLTSKTRKEKLEHEINTIRMNFEEIF